MFECKPDFEKVFERYEAWWAGAILDRPLVSITFPRPAEERKPMPGRHHASLRDRWLDSEYVAECAAAAIHNTVHYADSLPVAWPNLGPLIFPAFYGCELEFGEDTVWSRPVLEDWSPSSLGRLRLDTGGFYYRKLEELTDALLEVGRGRFLVGYTDLHGGADALAAFRGSENLLMDVLENREAVRALCERITGEFLDVYDRFHEKLQAAGMPSTTWLPVTGRGRVHVPSCDFSCMISGRDFEDLFLPGLLRECRHMDRCIYHLDGPGALRYLDRLLEIPEIRAIQWVPGAGRDYWVDHIATYQRIQKAGKSLQILSIPAVDLPRLFEALAPEGVWISSVTGIDTEEAAADVLRKIASWRRRP